jgi:hypothetical protein
MIKSAAYYAGPQAIMELVTGYVQLGRAAPEEASYRCGPPIDVADGQWMG